MLGGHSAHERVVDRAARDAERVEAFFSSDAPRPGPEEA